MGLLYAKDGKIHCNEYVEIYIPKSYFESGFAQNVGASIETFGLCYIKAFPNGNDGPIKLFNVPTVINLIIYDFSNTSISIYGKEIDVLALKYPKDSYLMNQSVVKGREVAESFLATHQYAPKVRDCSLNKLADVQYGLFLFAINPP